MSFHNFVTVLQKQLSTMAKTGLFEVAVDKDLFWNTYLDSFPEGTNLIYKERREYDCNCCKQFIRDVGRVVTFVDGKKVSLWDVQVGGYYQVVADALAAMVRSSEVENVFYHFTAKVGTAQSVILNEDNTTRTFNHFHAVLPQASVMQEDKIATKLNDIRGNKAVLERSLRELSLEAGETVLDLISQNSLYRGNEQKGTVEAFLSLKRQLTIIDELGATEAFLWTKAVELGGFGKFRNTAMGTLLENLTEGMDLEQAVAKWEAIMAPTNYKRPTALITESMIRKAQEQIVAMGMLESLPRRYATVTDLTINNVLFADRSAKKAMNVFDDLVAANKQPRKGLNCIEEISVEEFLANVLPRAESIEVLLENRHQGNLMSLVAPVYQDAPNMLKWDNNFSWSYNGGVADSIKERVKAAGGNVDAALRVSLSWHCGDDLDLHLHEPSGAHLYFANRHHSSPNGGKLDVDMNAGGARNSIDPVENIVYPRGMSVAPGEYRIEVKNYSARDNINPKGYEIEVEVNGEVFNFASNTSPRDGQTVKVVTLVVGRDGKVSFKDGIKPTKISKQVWGLDTEQFHKVDMVLNSPNHWDGQTAGNKHLFFILNGAANPEGTRGFYNEYLREDLYRDHRKVFEHLGAKMQVPASDEQLSGVGFSDTVRNDITVKVNGATTRTMKVKF